MSDIAIRVENLGKRYRIGTAHQWHATLRDAISDFGLQIADLGKRALKSEIRNLKSEIDSFWALKDVSFEACPESGEGSSAARWWAFLRRSLP